MKFHVYMEAASRSVPVSSSTDNDESAEAVQDAAIANDEFDCEEESEV